MNQLKSILLILKQLFPPYLLIIANYPLLIGAFINYDLIDSREIALNFIWILVFTIPYNLVKNKTFYKSILVFYFTLSLIETLHWIILKGPLTLTSLLVISATNYYESVGFLSIKLGFNLLLLFPLFILFWRGLKGVPIITASKLNNYFIIGSTIILIVFISENAINKRFIRKGTPNFLKVTATFIDKINLYKEVAENQKPKKVDAKTSNTNQTFVLVLGESCNRNHMELYGAKNSTNPKLKSRNDLHQFNDVISAYSNTISSVLSSLSESNIENQIPTEKSIDILDIFSSAGFDTYWISNQSPVGIWENLVTIFANKSDHKIFVNTTSNSSFEATLNSSYDEKVVKPFKTSLNQNNTKKFIVIHLMGSHTAYHKRYPKEFDKFKGNTNKKQTIAEYHNSILYTDFIVDSLINILDKANLNSSLIYLSDHGENVYDESDKVGHDFAGTIPKSHVEIPFIIWTSEKYKTAYPNKISAILNNTNKPFMLDNLFHTIIDLNQINTPYFDKTLSNINSNYIAKRPRILEDGNNYDLD
jgi:heptose-I-phosphate ethanolaminephosphotransferase